MHQLNLATEAVYASVISFWLVEGLVEELVLVVLAEIDGNESTPLSRQINREEYWVIVLLVTIERIVWEIRISKDERLD
jgi:hypothetical protein